MDTAENGTLSDAKAGAPAPHAGVVAVVGRTNAGKSTLVNRLVGEKVSIVSPVVQTTRTTVRGVLTEARGQLVLLDTPGLHKSRTVLGTAMNKAARASASGADAVLLVCDASRPPELEDEGWMQRLARSPAPVVIFLNKADESCRERAFREVWDRAVEHAEARAAEPAAQGGASPPGEPPRPWKRKRREAGELRPIVRPLWLSGSAKTGDGVDALLDAIFGLLPAGPLLFDGDLLTDHPEKLAVADVIREKLFGLFRDELPHSIGVSVERIERRGDGSVAVSGTVYVRKANQKGIVLGEKGRTLRTAKRRAEAELREYFGAPSVDCELWVRVEPDWDGNFFLLRKLGYA
jgi:GTP-binding protein Era